MLFAYNYNPTFNPTILYLLKMVILAIYWVSIWRVFEKAGEAGWKIFIPFYNQYIEFKIAKKEKWFWVSLVSTIVAITALFFTVVNSFYIAPFYPMHYNYYGFNLILTFVLFGVFILASAGMIASAVVKAMATARVFGMEKVFGIGLLLFRPVFLCILGFDKKIKYVDAKIEEELVAPVDLEFVEEIKAEPDIVEVVEEAEEK